MVRMTAMVKHPEVQVVNAGGDLTSDYSSVFSFDTKFLYCPSGTVIQVFSVATGRFCGQLEGHTDRITSLLLNERNHLQLISGSLDGFLVIWDIGTEYASIKTINISRPIHKVIQLKCFANTYLVVVDNKLSGSYDVVDIGHFAKSSASAPHAFLSLQHFDAKSVSFGYETGVVAAIDGRRKVLVWLADLARTTSISATAAGESFTGITCHPVDKNVVAVSTSIGRIYVWTKLFVSSSSSAGPASFQLHWHSHVLRSIAFSPEGTFLFSAGEECVFVKWLWRKQQRTFLPRIGAPVSSVAISPDGAAYALGLVDNSIAIVSSNLIFLRAIRGYITGVKIPAIRPTDSHSLDSGSTGNETNPSFSPAGLLFDRRSRALVCNSRPGHLQFFDAENDRNVALLDATAENYVSTQKIIPVTEVIKADISFDGTWLATVQSRFDLKGECTLKIWQFDAEKTKTFRVNTVSSRAHLKEIAAVKFSTPTETKDIAAKNLRLVTASLDGVFRLWRCRPLLSENPKTSLQHQWENTFSSSYHALPLVDADWSADGSLFAVAAGPYVLLVDGNLDGEDSGDSSKMDGITKDSDSWLLGSLTADANSRINTVRFGRKSDASFLVGCSNDGEGFVCVWNLKTLQMTWKTHILLPCLVSDPLSDYMAVFSGAALQQKKILVFHPSSPAATAPITFHLPAICSDALSAIISPITSAVFVPNTAADKSDSERDRTLPQSDIYFLTRDQRLYALSMAKHKSEKCSSNGETKKFKFSGPSLVATGGLPQSSLAIFLSAGISRSLKSDIGTEQPATRKLDSKSISKFDSLFETPPHLLPPVNRICQEFLLRRCAECCGVSETSSALGAAGDNTEVDEGVDISIEEDNSMVVDDSNNGGPSAATTTSTLIHEPKKIVVRSDPSWIREIM